MNVDVYTKGVLTVLAVCLVWLCLNSVTPIVGAQAKPADPMPVILVDRRGTPIYTSEGFRVDLGTRALPVIVNNAAVPVQVTNPSIQVQVLRDPPTLRPVP